ncbi:YbaB/EbfC family nucleoid-associated protein [Nocardia concava]|uniref:YbaB/EbfC family nucleoid-associated protein n=1 Tax=Nocardia concava TaxID=257281 RepID=UPI000304225A|nr:YbaB/EbfC family nucleoid-associated protein [Nocardia concava]
MGDDAELLAERIKQVDDAILQVRGRAQASEGLVIVESDAYGAITDLRISPYAMSADADRLASVIVQCHRTARQRAEAEAGRVHAKLEENERRAKAPAAPVPAAPEWEEPVSHRITFGI